jgi:hypothetical protein
MEVPICKCIFSAAEVDMGSVFTVINQIVLLCSSAPLRKTALERALHVFTYFYGYGTSCLSRGITVLIVVKYH